MIDTNKRAAQSFLLRYLGADDILASLVEEANKTGNPWHMEQFNKHLDSAETALSELLECGRQLREDIHALRSRLAYERMNARHDLPPQEPTKSEDWPGNRESQQEYLGR
jgi:hypothetical protein